MAEPARQRMTYAEFLAFERAGEVKHEWLDGEVVAMTGGSRAHALLISRAIHHLSLAVTGGPCEVYSSELMVRIPGSGLSTYPDAAVVCGEFVGDAENEDALNNPLLLVEVLSPSTERWDRGGKFRHYRSLASLRCYLLVNQDHQLVEWYTRNDDGSWAYDSAGPGEVVVLDGPPLELAVDDIYRSTGVPLLAMPPVQVREPEPVYRNRFTAPASA